MKKTVLFMLLIHLFVQQARSQCTFGNFPPAFTSSGGWTNSIWIAKMYTLSTTATLTGLGLNANSSSLTQYKMALYSDASGLPGSLISATGTGTMVTGQNTLSVTTPTVLAAGSYWVLSYYYSSGTPVTNGNSSTPFYFQLNAAGTLPASASTWTNGGNVDMDTWAVINTPLLSVGGSTGVCIGSAVTLTANGASSYTWSTGVNTTTISAAPATNTVYTLSGTGSNGCIASITSSLAVNPLPTISIAGNNTICAGSSITQTVSGASTYSWSTGATSNTLLVAPTSNTVYYVNGTNASGCTSTGTRSVTVNTLPVLTITGNNTLCVGSVLTQTVSGAVNYSWSTGATGSTVSLSPATTTVYTVSGVDANNCSNTATRSITVNALPTLTISGSGTLCAGSSITQTVSGAASYSWSSGTTTSIVTLSPATNTVYSATGTATTGCSATITHSVTVYALPVVSIAGNNSVCAGASVLQTATGASSYNWSSGATTSTALVSPATSSVYTVTGTDLNGCAGTATVNIFVNPLPTVTIAGNNSVCVGSLLTLTASGAANYSWNVTATTAVIFVSLVSNTVYVVNGTSAAGCMATASLAVTAQALPVLSIAGNTTICSGAIATQTISGAASYNWSTGAGTYTVVLAPTTTSVYTATGTGINSCTASITETITVNALPVLSTSLSSAVLCNGETGTITASGALTWLWNTGATTMALPVSPTVTTTYTVTGLDANGCSATAAVTQTVSDCTGLNNQKLNSSPVSIWPNPGTGLFELKVNNSEIAYSIRVYNANGALLKQEEGISGTVRLDLSDVSSGLYYVLIENNQGKQVVKLIKE